MQSLELNPDPFLPPVVERRRDVLQLWVEAGRRETGQGEGGGGEEGGGEGVAGWDETNFREVTCDR